MLIKQKKILFLTLVFLLLVFVCPTKQVKADISYGQKTYTDIVKAAKSYKSKNILFDNIDIGYHSKLYCEKAAVLYNTKNATKDYYFFRVSYMPYINMVKKSDDTCKIELNFSGLFRSVSLFSFDNNIDQIMFYTKNRRIKFDLEVDETEKVKNRIYYIDSKYKANLSNNKNIDGEKLNKLITIFEQEDVSVSISGEDGLSASVMISESYRKQYLRLFKIYRKLIEM